MKNKRIYVQLITVLISVFTIWVLNNILEYKSPHGMNQTRAFYVQPKNSIDLLAVGSSHVHCGINTGELWSEYGYAAYDLSAAEQPLWITYYYLKEAYKYQSPKVVVLDLFSPARFKDDYHYKWIEESIYGLKFSKNKLEMLDVAVEDERRSDYFPAYLSFHNRYINLNKEDLYNIFGNHKEKIEFKGYTPSFNVVDQSEKFGGWDELEDYGLTLKNRNYLEKIIDLTSDHGSELVLIVVPYNLDSRDSATYDEVESIAKQYDLTYINFCDYLDEIGIDKSKDFNDHTHLNYWGSVKFTKYFGEIIKEMDLLQDKRNKLGYESWNKNAQNIINNK